MKRLLTVVAVGLLASNVYADSLKVGVVNLDQVVQQSALSASLNSKLSADFKPRQDELNAAQKRLQDDADQLNYNGYKLTADERLKLQTTINTDKRQFDMLNTSLQTDLAAAQAKYSQALMAKLKLAINKIAQDGKYDIIQTNANMLYLNGSIDVTKAVIDQLK